MMISPISARPYHRGQQIIICFCFCIRMLHGTMLKKTDIIFGQSGSVTVILADRIWNW